MHFFVSGHPFESASSSNAAAAAAAAMCSTNTTPLTEPTVSPFAEASHPKLTPEKISQSIRDEIRRLNHRGQLTYASAAAVERMNDSESSGSEMGGPDSPRRCHSPPSMLSLVKNPELAVFTFKQVQMICERLVREREQHLVEQYDAVLNTKLAEQYDAFIKFTYDQIQNRIDTAPSYLS